MKKLYYQSFKGGYYANLSRKAFLSYLQNCGGISRKVKIVAILRGLKSVKVLFYAKEKAYEDKAAGKALDIHARMKAIKGQMFLNIDNGKWVFEPDDNIGFMDNFKM
jgi:hypothetical protein